MNPASVIALCSIGISVISTVIMLAGQRHTASTDYVAQLEKRIENLQRELQAAEDRIQSLEDKNGALLSENIELMRKLARLNGTK
jgi:peptidoglycan hydrolase CwlO-like protein